MLNSLLPFTGFFLVLQVFICVSIAIFYFIFYWRIYVKMGEPGWKGIIPVYNTIVLLKLLKKPSWWIAVFLSPLLFYLTTLLFIRWQIDLMPAMILLIASTLVAAVYAAILYYYLTQSFGYPGAMVVLMIFFPVIYLAIVAFDSNTFTPPVSGTKGETAVLPEPVTDQGGEE